MNKSKLISYRGHCIEAPPNSESAIRQALDYNIDGIMLDVTYTSDEVIVCNAEWDDTNIPDNKITSHYSYSQLKDIDLSEKYGEKYKNEKILTIEEAFEILKGKTSIYLHLICGSRHFPNIEERILDYLTEIEAIDDTTIISLDHMALKWLKKVNPTLKTIAMHYSRPAKPVDFALDILADGIAAFHFLLTRFAVDAAHRELLEVYGFPVSTREDVEHMIDIKADGILSKNSELLTEFV